MAIELSEAETEKIREGVCSEEELAGIAQAAAERFRREAICVQEANTGAIFAGC